MSAHLKKWAAYGCTPIALLACGRWSHTATLLPDRRVLVTGGCGSANTLDSVELYTCGPVVSSAGQP